MTSSIGVVFIVYNQADLLNLSLKNLAKTGLSVYVADLSSTQDIVGVCQKWGATYIKLPYAPIVETIRNEVFDRIKTDYLLYLDADESVEHELITKLKSLAETSVDFVKIPRQNYFFNSWVKASRWWPDYQVRFFKRGTVTFPTQLHSEPLTIGQGLTLDPDPKLAIKHLNYRSLDEWFEKNRRYAKADAQDRLSFKQSFSIIDAMKLSVSELVSRFFAGGGHADGMHGLILSILQSFYYFLVYAYYWEAKKYQASMTPSELKSFPRAWFTYGLSEIIYWDSIGGGFVNKIKDKFKRKLIA
ncbi:MAG: glycosyltransferase family 2 protein [Candidatus Microgenomates bacterium]